MAERRYATQIHATYENFEAICPSCQRLNIFNRASDLKTFLPISFREVECLHCTKTFRINRDTVGAAYRWFLFGGRELIEAKRYMDCVLHAAQAFETFFSFYLRITLVHKPYGTQRGARLTEVNALLSKLYTALRDLSYKRLRDVFLNTALADREMASMADASQAIDGLLAYARRTPTDRDIKQHNNPRIAALLQQVKDSKVHELRNQVVHKDAYRPTLEEARAAIQEAGDILFPLGVLLDLELDGGILLSHESD